MTRGTIVTLALLATALLAVGARLLEAPSPVTLVLGTFALVLGTVLAAAAVVGAWRPPATTSDTAQDRVLERR